MEERTTLSQVKITHILLCTDPAETGFLGHFFNLLKIFPLTSLQDKMELMNVLGPSAYMNWSICNTGKKLNATFKIIKGKKRLLSGSSSQNPETCSCAMCSLSSN